MKAVAAAARIALAFDQPLHIASAYKPIAAQSGLPLEFQGSVSPTSRVEAILEDAAARARVGGVKAECHMRRGDPAEVLLDLAQELEVSVLVVGNKGIGSAKRFLLGNVPSKVVHHSPCSTLVVHTT